MRKIRTFLSILGGAIGWFIVLIIIWNVLFPPVSDYIQKKYYPEEYWSNYWNNRVEELEKSIEYIRASISEMTIELEIIHRTANLETAKSTIYLKNQEDISKMAEISSKIIQSEIETIKNLINKKKNDLLAKQEEIKKAKSELLKYQIIK